MKNRYDIFGCLVALLGVMTGLYSCTDELDGIGIHHTRPSDVICFTASLSESRTASMSRSSSGHLEIEQEEWLVGVEEKQSASRGNPVTLLNGSAGVIGYVYDDAVSGVTPSMYNKQFNFDGDALTANSEDERWQTFVKKPNTEIYKKVLFHVYAPYNLSGGTLSAKTVTGTPTLTYTVDNNDVKKQHDLIVSSWEGAKGTNYGTGTDGKAIQPQSIPLVFEHALTAVKFNVGFACTVTKLEVEGIYHTGTYTFGEGWNVDKTSTSGYDFTFGKNGAGEKFEAKAALTQGETTLMMIPQKLGSDAKVILTYDDGKTIEATLKDKVWEAGKMITYTIHKDEAPATIYFDLAAGNVTIGDNEVVGYVYNKGKKDPEKKIYNHQDGNNYYVYQSTASKRNADNPTGVMDGKTVILPVYERVMYDGKLWSDYIINNTNVEQVIEAWDNEQGAGKATQGAAITNIKFNQEGADGAVREVGREATKNRIHIEGNVGNVNLFIDNIYSSYQQRGSVPVRQRKNGGISFLPSQNSGNSILTINIIGDNRLGCVNYQNNDSTKNCLVFEGTGSLTVADTDYYRDNTGLGSNRSCSVIGGKDEPKNEQDVYNIVFNSGIIYAGATTSACTAIGGGGNGHTKITINGGTITAVAKTTGTAIGGGSGLVQPGGEGNVTINGGNVYTYNYRNTSDVPSSAIGGAGSRDVDGSLGIVNIHGGYVFAYSEYGTAIGGGSSQKTKGGEANIKITGGQVIAVSGTGAGIGGGSACTGGKNNTTTKYNGGTATINISGNPIVRTGSIGGGNTNDPKGGKIGSANVTISGGDIQAQFVMAAGAKATPTFKMYGGTIRNSYVDDEEYIHIQKKGGAVYLEDGTFEMTGGTIKNCSAIQGGAVYIERKSTEPMDEVKFNFKMSGGEIHSCFATGGKIDEESYQGHGGAVCLNGGQIHMIGGKIYNNYSVDGDGGAIYVNNGNFYMKEGTPEISENAAQKGNGGGVFVASGGNTTQVHLLKGSISNNTANNYGGGVCVDMEDTENAADVIVGMELAEDETVTEANADPTILNNMSMMSGGGLYVRGTNANITINSGRIDKNTVAAYVKNENVANEGGEVILHKGLVDHKIVTFNGNGGKATIDGGEVETYTQKIVTNTNSKLIEQKFILGGYNFDGWNTRPDGLGKDYTDEAVLNTSVDITLYAKWKAQ